MRSFAARSRTNRCVVLLLAEEWRLGPIAWDFVLCGNSSFYIVEGCFRYACLFVNRGVPRLSNRAFSEEERAGFLVFVRTVRLNRAGGWPHVVRLGQELQATEWIDFGSDEVAHPHRAERSRSHVD